MSKFDLKYLLLTSLGAAEMYYVNGLQTIGVEVQVQPGTIRYILRIFMRRTRNQRNQNVLQKADPFIIEQVNAVKLKYFISGRYWLMICRPNLCKALQGRAESAWMCRAICERWSTKKYMPPTGPVKTEVLPYIDILKADVGEIAGAHGLQ